MRVMKINVKTIAILLGILLLCIVVSTDIAAQCPMCRMAAESNLKNGGSQGKGLNAGILYMLATPYVLIGVIGYVWWRGNKKNVEETNDSVIN